MMRTNADGMRARISRLEKLAGKGPCAYCRFERRRERLGGVKPRAAPKDPSLTLSVSCEECGTPHSKDLSSYPEELRELARLYSGSTLEDLFTDPRAWAAQRWGGYWAEARKLRRRALRARRDEPAQAPHAPSDYGRQQRAGEREKDPDVRLYNKRLAEALALVARRYGRLERRYGKNPFPELEARITAIKGPDLSLMSPVEALAHTREMLSRPSRGAEHEAWLLCAEMERIVLGEVSAYTSGLIADCVRREQEESARAESEMDEETRRRMRVLTGEEPECEPERERLEPEAAPPPAPPAVPPPSRESQMDRHTSARSQRRSQYNRPVVRPREPRRGIIL